MDSLVACTIYVPGATPLGAHATAALIALVLLVGLIAAALLGSILCHEMWSREMRWTARHALTLQSLTKAELDLLCVPVGPETRVWPVRVPDGDAWLERTLPLR